MLILKAKNTLQDETDHSVETKESFDGLIVKLFKGSIQKMLDKALRSVLAFLKAEADGPSADRKKSFGLERVSEIKRVIRLKFFVKLQRPRAFLKVQF